MSLLIDGYNLLHASGILGRGIGAGSLERSRNALLNFLAESLTDRELATTVVVFDAHEAPPGLPRVTQFRGLTVRFAPRGSDADAEIEKLIEECHAPRRLTVVSSDHRLHRAARRRRAKPIDSDRWHGEMIRRRLAGLSDSEPGVDSQASKPSGPTSEINVRYWLRIFGLEQAIDQEVEQHIEVDATEDPDSANSPTKPANSAPKKARREASAGKTRKVKKPSRAAPSAPLLPDDSATGAKPSHPSPRRQGDASPDEGLKEIASGENPFPPGYAEDITEDNL